MKDDNDNDNKNIDLEKLRYQMFTAIISIYGGTKNVKCGLGETIRDICKNANININGYYLIYQGTSINIDNRLENIINEDDKRTKIVRFLACEKIEKNNKIKSKDIICPRCGENIYMNIKDYKINLFDCNNKHKINNLLLNKFVKTQIIDLSKIICNICKQTKYYFYKHLLYRCLECGINICPLCKLKHDKNHKIINYDEKNYICIEHNERYIYYCPQCELNICLLCELKHKNHNISMFNRYNKNKLLDELYEFEKNIDNFNKSISEILEKFNNFKNHIIKSSFQ